MIPEERKNKIQGTPKKNEPAVRPLTTATFIKKLKASRFGIICVIDHFGEDGSECFTQEAVIHINRDHPLYKESCRNHFSYIMHIARLLTQEITLLTDPCDLRIVYKRQNKLMRDALGRFK
ncbi:hypothetical protein H5U35_06985 [Candidatus Aerophobetes bacterium]|nr:hypothetical protein [Candidatus Aerophobetes bacterium]